MDDHCCYNLWKDYNFLKARIDNYEKQCPHFHPSVAEKISETFGLIEEQASYIETLECEVDRLRKELRNTCKWYCDMCPCKHDISDFEDYASMKRTIEFYKFEIDRLKHELGEASYNCSVLKQQRDSFIKALEDIKE